MSLALNAPMRILLVDDHTLFRESLHRLLDSEPDLRVCGTFSTAQDAMVAIEGGLAFDVALVDYDLDTAAGSIANGLTLLAKIHEACSSARVLVVTAGMHPAALSQAIEQFGAGVFLKSEPTSELLIAIRKTARGEQWLSSRAALSLLAWRQPAQSRSNTMSPRELSVLRGVMEGKSNKQIGADLDFSESLVKAVLQRLFEKTGLRSRSQLVRFAMETQIDLEAG